MDVETALRDLLTDDRLDVPVRPGAVDAVHHGVRRRRRTRRVLAATSAAAAVALLGTGVVVAAGAAGDHRARPDEAAVPGADPSWTAGRPVPLPRHLRAATSISAFNGIVWLTAEARSWGSGTPGRLVRIDTSTGRARTFDVGGEPQGVAATPQRVWVVNGGGDGHAVPAEPCTLQQLDAATGRLEHTYDLGCSRSSTGDFAVTANGPHAYVAASVDNRHTDVVRVDALTGKVDGKRRLPGSTTGGARPITLGGTAVFVSTLRYGGDRPVEKVTTLDSESLRVLGTTTLPARGLTSLAYGEGRLFAGVDETTGGGVFAFDGTGVRPQTLTSDGANDVTTGGGVAWLLLDTHGGSAVDPHAVALDAGSSTPLDDVPLGAITAEYAAADGTTLWVLTGTPTGDRLQLVPLRPAP